MAILKVINENYSTMDKLFNLVNYVLNPDKMEYSISGFHLLYPANGNELLTRQIADCSNFYGTSYGTLAHHFIISYYGIFTYGIVKKMQKNVHDMILALLYDYPTFYALHDNTGNFHFHIVVCATNLYTGQKLPNHTPLHNEMASLLHLLSQYKKENDKRIYFIPYNIVYQGRKV